MWPSLALILPHKPDAVFQGQLVKVNFCWLAFEHDAFGRIRLRISLHHGDNLLLIFDSHTLAVAEASANGGCLFLIDLFKQDKLLSAWLHDLANFINIFCHTLDPKVDLGELEMNFNCFVNRTLAVRDEYAMVMWRVQRLDLTEGVRKRSLNALCYRLLKNLISRFLAQDELSADAELDTSTSLHNQDHIRSPWVQVQVHDLVFILIIVICRSNEFTAFAGSLVNHFSQRVLCLVAVLGVDVAEEHVRVRARVDDTECRASVLSCESLRLAFFNALQGI